MGMESMPVPRSKGAASVEEESSKIPIEVTTERVGHRTLAEVAVIYFEARSYRAETL